MDGCADLYECDVQALVHHWQKYIANGGDKLRQYCMNYKNFMQPVKILFWWITFKLKPIKLLYDFKFCVTGPVTTMSTLNLLIFYG